MPESDDMMQKMNKRFTEFLEMTEMDSIAISFEEGKPLVIDFMRLDRFDPDMAGMLIENPEDMLNSFEQAIEGLELPPHEKIKIRIKNLPKQRSIRIRNLRAKHINKLIEVEGVVKSVSEVKPQIYEALFRCPECGQTIVVKQRGQTLKMPLVCSCGRRGMFKLVETKKYDIRHLKINEPFEITEGEQPGEINVLLKEDLTTPEMQRKTDPGSQLKIVGYIKELPKRIQGKISTRPDVYFEAVFVEPREEEFDEITLSDEEKRKIMEMAEDPNIYERLIASIAPGIYGATEIKEAVLLQLFGGVRHQFEDGTHVRGNIHILITGDPSTAKSVLISNVVKALPRGRYVSGKGVTGSGLTTTVVKNEQIGSWVLEAGALILSNKSILAIDEFDKMSKDDQVAMHEAMSLETVSVAKASILATLPAQTAVLAAANPKLGRFDPMVPIIDQVMISETLLSRFDLKFALRDVPDRKRDEEIADHVLKSRMHPETTKPLLDTKLLRKYISYARKTCTDIKLTEEAAGMMKTFYVDMRNKYTSEGAHTVAITLRQYEALIRLAEASAKVRLDKYIRKEDAERSIKLVKFALQQLGVDFETGRIDIDKIESGITTSQRSKIRIVTDIINDLESKTGSKNISIEDVKAAAEEQGIKAIDDTIEKLRNDGTIFTPKPGYVRLVK